MNPIYSRDGITIYHGDAREILPMLDPVDVVITDPVWPNAKPVLIGSDDPYGLFAEVAPMFTGLADRVVIHLGCDSDPRFLAAMPAEIPFLRACWLEYVRPHYKGRILYTNDVAYVFGAAPPSIPGRHVMPGRMIQTDAAKTTREHPCPRQLQHVKWLVSWFANGTVLDPFMGSGTTLVAARDCGRKAIGIELDESFCDLAISRLQQTAMNLEVA